LDRRHQRRDRILQGDAYYKKEYPNAKGDLYIEQIQIVQVALKKGDTGAAYVAMNQFMARR